MLSLGAGGKWFPNTGTNTQHCLLLAPAPEVERLGVGGWDGVRRDALWLVE